MMTSHKLLSASAAVVNDCSSLSNVWNSIRTTTHGPALQS